MRASNQAESAEKLCVQDSRLTDTTSQLKCRRKINLNSCRSMVSVESDQGRGLEQGEKILFMKYLMNRKSQTSRKKYLGKMRELFLRIYQKESEGNDKIDLGQLPDYLILSDRGVVQYYMWGWLVGMGYLSPGNRNQALQRFHLTVPESAIPEALKFYECLGEGYLPEMARHGLIEDVCASGWEGLWVRIATYFNSRPPQ